MSRKSKPSPKPIADMALPMIRRSYPELLAPKLVSVEASRGPVAPTEKSTYTPKPYDYFHSFDRGYGIYDENCEAVYKYQNGERYRELHRIRIDKTHADFIERIRITNIDALNEIKVECESRVEAELRKYEVYSRWETEKSRTPRPFDVYADMEMWKLKQVTDRIDIVLSPSGV